MSVWVKILVSPQASCVSEYNNPSPPSPRQCNSWASCPCKQCQFQCETFPRLLTSVRLSKSPRSLSLWTHCEAELFVFSLASFWPQPPAPDPPPPWWSPPSRRTSSSGWACWGISSSCPHQCLDLPGLGSVEVSCFESLWTYERRQAQYYSSDSLNSNCDILFNILGCNFQNNCQNSWNHWTIPERGLMPVVSLLSTADNLPVSSVKDFLLTNCLHISLFCENNK